MSITRAKLENWVLKYPDGYLHNTISEIATQAGISITSAGRYLFEIIADRDGILPSEVVARRSDAGYKQNPRSLDAETIRKIHELDDADIHPRDIAYQLGIGYRSVEKHLNKRVR